MDKKDKNNETITNTNIKTIDLNTRSKDDFLNYANAVNRARAIPLVEDNLKPIHRKILYTFYITKLTSDKEPKKSMATVGEVLKLSPHGDAATYGALVRLAQGWKLRYPLVEMQGNCGNLLGMGPAAARYTNAKLSKIGDLMLEDIDKDCVDFVPNYDESMEEPVTLPGKFPWLLCGNNSGIGVSLSSSIVSHNFTEVKNAIEYYLTHKDTCTVEDLMRFIKGPDFPTGGKIVNGEDLISIYKTGSGVLKMEPHYDIVKSGKNTKIIFHDLPYGVEINDGVKAPLKKYVVDNLESNGKDFENIDIKKAKDNFFDITITLSPKANIAACLNILLTKTQLASSVKVNNVVIKDNQIVCLNLRQMVEEYVNYRSNIIKKIAQNNYDKTNHKLTVVLGLQKCISDIDKLIAIIRNAESRNAAFSSLKKEFTLNDEQANAVLDMKLSKLSRLDVKELNDSEKNYESTLAQLKDRIDNEESRYEIIKKDLEEIKSTLGEDKRLTEITYGINPNYTHADANNTKMATEIPINAIKRIFYTYKDGRILETYNNIDELCAINLAYGVKEIIPFNAQAEIGPTVINNPIGAFVKSRGNKIVMVTKKGNIKVTLASEYKWKVGKKPEKLMKLHTDDELIFAGACTDEDFLILTNGRGALLKLSIKKLTIANKMTVGVKSGFDIITSACVAANSDNLVMISQELDGKSKGKIVSTKDLDVDNRGNKGQTIYKQTKWIINVTDRNCFYVGLNRGGTLEIDLDKLSVKGKTAAGITITNRINLKAAI